MPRTLVLNSRLPPVLVSPVVIMMRRCSFLALGGLSLFLCLVSEEARGLSRLSLKSLPPLPSREEATTAASSAVGFGSSSSSPPGRALRLRQLHKMIVPLRAAVMTTDTATTTWKGTKINVVISPPNVTGGQTVDPKAPTAEEAVSSLKSQLEDPQAADPAMQDFFKDQGVNTSEGMIPAMKQNNTKPPDGITEAPTSPPPQTPPPVVAKASDALAGAATTTAQPGNSALGGALVTTTTHTTTKLTGTARPAPAKRVQFVTEVPPIRPLHREVDLNGHIMECTPDACVQRSQGGHPVFIPALEPTEPPPPPPPPR